MHSETGVMDAEQIRTDSPAKRFIAWAQCAPTGRVKHNSADPGPTINACSPRSFLIIPYALAIVAVWLIRAAIAAIQGRMESAADKLRLMSSARTPSDTTVRTGALLRQAREHAGITQRELAKRLGCTQPAISQAEAGGASLSVATLRRFADALGCDLQLAIVSREVTLKHGVSATFRRPQLKAQEKQWSGS